MVDLQSLNNSLEDKRKGREGKGGLLSPKSVQERRRRGENSFGGWKVKKGGRKWKLKTADINNSQAKRERERKRGCFYRSTLTVTMPSYLRASRKSIVQASKQARVIRSFVQKERGGKSVWRMYVRRRRRGLGPAIPLSLRLLWYSTV